MAAQQLNQTPQAPQASQTVALSSNQPNVQAVGFFEGIYDSPVFDWIPGSDWYGSALDKFWSGEYFKDPIGAWEDTLDDTFTEKEPDAPSDGTTPTAPTPSAGTSFFLQSFSFVIAFIVLTILIAVVLGEKVATYFLGLVLLSMLLLNSNKMMSLFDSTLGENPSENRKDVVVV